MKEDFAAAKERECQDLARRAEAYRALLESVSSRLTGELANVRPTAAHLAPAAAVLGSPSQALRRVSRR